MLNPSLAPVRRAAIFFGFMALGVTALTAGPAFQPVSDQSSPTVAMQRGSSEPAADLRFAAVDPTHRGSDQTKRAIATSQEARLPSNQVIR